jgi:hypothetical protein
LGTSTADESAIENPREVSKREPKPVAVAAETPAKPADQLRKAAEALRQGSEGDRKTASSQRAAELTTFQSAEGRFSILMPGTPQKQNLSVSGISTTAYAIEEKDGGYVVVFADLPIPARESAQQTQQRLDGARDGMLRNINAQLTSETPLLLAGKYPGREINADLPEQQGILRSRIYIVGQRLYQVMVVGKATWARSSLASQFLDSLAVTTEQAGSTTSPSPVKKHRSMTR